MKADSGMTIWVERGTVTQAHLSGRMADRTPVDMFGRAWTVTRSEDDDRGVRYELRPAGAPAVMCTGCGSFEWDQPGGRGDRYECTECPNRGWPDGLLF